MRSSKLGQGLERANGEEVGRGTSGSEDPRVLVLVMERESRKGCVFLGEVKARDVETGPSKFEERARSSNLLGDNPASQIGELECARLPSREKTAAKGRGRGGNREGAVGGGG